MSSTERKLLLTAAGVSLTLATIAGAIGSHVLPAAEEQLRSFETAVRFQFFHGLGVIGMTVVGLAGTAGRVRAVAAWLMLIGTLLFCGTIYARALGAPAGVVAAAPYGGVAFMLAWLAFAASPWLEAGGRE